MLDVGRPGDQGAESEALAPQVAELKDFEWDKLTPMNLKGQGVSILIAESNAHHIPDYVDRIYVLERGEVMFSGTLAQAYQDRDVMRVIAGQIEVAS